MNDQSENFQRYFRRQFLPSGRRMRGLRVVPERERFNAINFNINDITRNEDLRLSKIRIKNFKSIQNSEFDINQTVFLSGLNSSGKSSYTQAILLVLQWMTGSTTGRNGYIPLNGELISLGETNDIYHRNSLHEDSKHLYEPIVIEMEFVDEYFVSDGVKYKILFELRPEFYLDRGNNSKWLRINPDNEIEIVKASTVITISRRDDVNLDDFFEKIISDRDASKHFRKLIIEKDNSRDRGVDHDLIIEQTYQKTDSLYSHEKMTHKRWAGDLLMNRKNNDLFYIPDISVRSYSTPDKKVTLYSNSRISLDSNVINPNPKVGELKVPEFIQKITYGKQEIYDSRLFPSEIRIGNELLPSGFIKDPNDILAIKTQSQRFSNNPNDMKKINSFRDSELKKESLDQIVSSNSIAIKGLELAKIRLLTQTINDIIFANNKVVNVSNPLSRFEIKSLFDTFRNLNIKFDQKGFESFPDVIKNLNKKDLRKKSHKYDSTEPYIDQTLCLLLNIFDIKHKNPEVRRRGVTRSENDLSKIQLSNFGFEIKESEILNNSREYLKKLSDNIKHLKYSSNIGGFETNESYRKLKSQDRIQVRDVIDSLSELFENYMVSIDEEQGFEWNYQGFSRSSGEIFPIFEKFLKSPAGKFLAEEQRQFGDTIIQIYLEFLDILKELSSKSESFSKNLWNEIRQTKSVVTGGIYEFDGKNMFTSTVDSYVVKTFLSVFPSIEKKSQASIEDIRKLLILTIGLRAIDINKYNNLVYDQKLKNLTFKKIMSDEKIKPTMKNMKMLSERDNSRSFQIDKNNGTTSYRFDSKMNENDYVFVSVEDKLVDRKWFPNISEKFSFLSGSVNRNYQSLSGRSLLAPIGYHGESIGAKFQLESNNSFELPTPNSLKILSDEKFRDQFVNPDGRVNPLMLFSANVKNPFIETRTMSDHLGSWLNYVGLGESISSRTSDFGFTTLSLESERGIDKLNNVGSGVSQALPVIFQILLSQDKVLFLEEIEQNLHASAQARLADMVLLFSLDPKRNFIIETHSEHFVNRLRYWKMTFGKFFEKDSDSPFNVYFAEINNKKGTTLKRMDVDEDGYFIEDIFPKGFFDQTQKDLLEIMRLRNKED